MLSPLAAVRRRRARAAHRLLQHCDAVQRLPGESLGADQDVEIARERGIPVFHALEEIPTLG